MSRGSMEPGGKPAARRWVALTGNPNCGKTTLFNALTGLRARVGNYSGVTVERKEGRLKGSHENGPVTVLDLPGTYSLSPQSLDEAVARDVLLHRLEEVPALDMIVVVVDASNLQRNLYYATQVIELGRPTVIALNMMDVARENGRLIDPERLARALGVPVIPMVASRAEGIDELRRRIVERTGVLPKGPSARFSELPDVIAREVEGLAAALLRPVPSRPVEAWAEALLLLGDERNVEPASDRYGPELVAEIHRGRARLDASGRDWRTALIEARYRQVAEICERCETELETDRETVSDRLDRVLTHRVWGLVLLAVVLGVMFQSIFTLAELPMTLLEEGVGWLGSTVAGWLPAGDLRSLLVDGVIAGVGAVVVFLPQICLLFLFIGLLEDTGYMARAAFLMDRLMSKVGLHGKSFIPMLSSFACAVPGIMATRTIESAKDRLVTILVAPLMSCSARLPVYTLLIAACIPDREVFGLVGLRGVTMLGMYLLGILVALVMAWIFKKTLLRGHTPLLILELPPYKRPLFRVVFRHMWDRAKLFLRRAGTVILGINILLWFLATYPRQAALEERFTAERERISSLQSMPDTGEPVSGEARRAMLEQIEQEASGERLRQSFAGKTGRLIEPLIAPLGFDWKIGIGIVTSFAAREVFVSTMSVVYNVGQAGDPDAATGSLARVMQAQTRADGSPMYTALTGVTLMVFYVIALQCVSTIAVVRRETNSWGWAVFQWAYMAALAWVLAFVTWQGGRLLGLG
ncbi:MAG: ferrous iron transport protein B [Verrucomicrobiales bacterium]|nr:ferrous iron transport protein B [Verrucomicrobiales bacterium]